MVRRVRILTIRVDIITSKDMEFEANLEDQEMQDLKDRGHRIRDK